MSEEVSQNADEERLLLAKKMIDDLRRELRDARRQVALAAAEPDGCAREALAVVRLLDHAARSGPDDELIYETAVAVARLTREADSRLVFVAVRGLLRERWEES